MNEAPSTAGWVSVDVEAAGPNPGTYSLLTIGACLVDDPSVGIELALKPVTDAEDPSAMAVSGLSLTELAERGAEPAEAMARFESWLVEALPAGVTPVFVGFNGAFDWMFVADYFGRFLGRNPFGHAAIDIKSFAMGVGGMPWEATRLRDLAPRYGLPRELAHSALQDARDQAVLLGAILAEQRAGAAR